MFMTKHLEEIGKVFIIVLDFEQTTNHKIY